ncbi:hypothetical protein [Streptomyces sp. NPDC002990]
MEYGTGPVPPHSQKGTPMYEMRAESTGDRRELFWHVIAKDGTARTLCGCHLEPPRPIEALPDSAFDRYCARCMAAVHTAGESRT